MTIPVLADQYRALARDGFVVVRGFADAVTFAKLRSLAVRDLAAAVQPVELEADVGYSGAPTANGAGSSTVRRLLDAYGRDEMFRQWATSPMVRDWLQGYFESTPVLSLAHHNCIMTKHPRFGTSTGWHQDIRYWSFLQPDLVSVWLALGAEHPGNGGLWFIPGSHMVDFERSSFDDRMFFRTDEPSNTSWLERAVSPELAPGDAVFFHCRCLHSAQRNDSDAVKLSLVHTYHPESNAPVPNTRSASVEEVRLGT